jgi:hydroxymethylbilane synthase
MAERIRIGTRESRLAVWQADRVRELLSLNQQAADLVFIRSEGDQDQETPLYALGVQGIFTKALDNALLAGRIDLAVHSMKDVPLQLARGLAKAAILERGPFGDLLVYSGDGHFIQDLQGVADIATGSVRRRAQWLHRYPNHRMHELRGNMETRLGKLESSSWDGAIFAQAGLERIGRRPENSRVLDWMLPAPAQGAILCVCRVEDSRLFEACQSFHHESTASCVEIERDFLKALLGGCSTPISALALEEGGLIHFRGNIASPDGRSLVEIDKKYPAAARKNTGAEAAKELLSMGGKTIADEIRKSPK